MTDRIFEDARSLKVSDHYSTVEVYVSDPGEVMITITGDYGCGSEGASVTMTAKEATALKKFLISKGY